MRLETSQQMRMLQQMKLAPRMIQSMEILQLPIMALEERIRQEEEQNPTIELGISTNETPTTDLEAKLETNTPAEGEPETKADDGPSDQEFEAFEQLVEEYSDSPLPSHQPSRAMSSELADKKHDAIQNMADRPMSLEDYLLEQLLFDEEEPLVLEFARHIIGNLDTRGFLNGPLEEIRRTFSEPMTDAQAERALKLVQKLDPRGAGATDLRECLLLQLDDPEIEIPHREVLHTIIADHLDDLEHNRLPAISRKTGYSLELIHDAMEGLKHLDLNPGGKFTSSKIQYVVPDVTIEPGEDGLFTIKMNDDRTPNVRISKHYLKLLHEKRGDRKSLEWIKRKINAARWLIDSIEQRRQTLEKITRAIVEHQKTFLENKADNIEPLKMQQIADRVGVHVTTVSRAVDDKWVQTPRGNFPLKRFFGGGTVTDSGEEVAWEAIKQKLTELIDGEDKMHPLSDDELVKKLKEHGYPCARRTVTKYRMMLNIPSSRQRKQHVTVG